MAAADERGSVCWRNQATALCMTLLLIALMGAAGHRLWQNAQAGIAATERHIVTLVEVETLRKQIDDPGTALAADVQSVLIKGSAAMVRVVVTETSSLGEISPQTKTLFYRQTSAGWKRRGPIAAFWGQAATLDTTTLHFKFYELDRPNIEAVAEPADDFHRTLREFLGLPPLGAAERITVTVVPKKSGPAILADGRLVAPSPILSNCNGDCQRARVLLVGLHWQLVARSLQESQIQYGVHPRWEPMYMALAGWLINHADELPTILNDRVQDRHALPLRRRIYLFSSPVADAPYYAADSFFYALVADRGPTAIPALLAAFGKEDNWPGVVQTAYGVSVGDLRAEWKAYLRTLRKAPGPAEGRDSPILR